MRQFDKIFVINSRNRSDRFRNMCNRFKQLGLTDGDDYHAREQFKTEYRFDAIHGGEIDWSRPEYSGLIVDDSKVPLNNGEIGCWISHRTIFKMIKESGWKKTLILEDDALFCIGFPELLEYIYPIIPEYDMLYFGQWNYDKGVEQGEKAALKEKVAECENRGVYKAERCWLTHAYVVDNSIIDILLDNTKILYASFDRVLADIQEKEKLKVYAIHPALITQDGTKSSLRN